MNDELIFLSVFSPSPAHDRCESVVVALCYRGPDGLVHHLSSEQMCFVQDLALDMAQFLVSAVGQDEETEGALLLNECHIPLQECEKMDLSLALAFRHLTLPPDWTLLGGNNGEMTCWSSPYSYVATQVNLYMVKSWHFLLPYSHIPGKRATWKYVKDKIDSCTFLKQNLCNA